MGLWNLAVCTSTSFSLTFFFLISNHGHFYYFLGFLVKNNVKEGLNTGPFSALPFDRFPPQPSSGAAFSMVKIPY